MTRRIVLDMTRAVGRRWRGASPSGIDRVCDAYAQRFADTAYAALQVRGRGMVLDRLNSARLFAALYTSKREFRRTMVGIFSAPLTCAARRDELIGATYINTGHTDFDLAAHWRWIEGLGLQPIYLIHDLIPITHPEVTTPHKTRRHRGRVERALSGAAGIVANSASTADEIARFALEGGRRLPPILAAPIAGGTLRPRLRNAEAGAPTFLTIGTIEPRKNHALLLDVWDRLVARLGAEAPRLVIAGSWGRGSRAVRSRLASDPELSAHVSVVESPDDAQLAALMGQARAVLLPSSAEGFGLPLVEALEAGVPVLASDLPSFRETGEGIPTLLPVGDIEAWTAAIAEFSGPSLRRDRLLALVDTFAAPCWKDHFAALDTWLDRLLNAEGDHGRVPVGRNADPYAVTGREMRA